MSDVKFNSNAGNDISNLFGLKTFANAPVEIQKTAIENITINKQLELEGTSIMRKLLGAKMPNMAVYSAFILCCVLIVFILLLMLIPSFRCKNFVLEMVKIIIPVFTMSLGYMFGKNDTHE